MPIVLHYGRTIFANDKINTKFQILLIFFRALQFCLFNFYLKSTTTVKTLNLSLIFYFRRRKIKMMPNFAFRENGEKMFFPVTYLCLGHQATPYGNCYAPSSYQGQSHEIRATRQAMQAKPLGSSSRTANKPPEQGKFC
jgi:hypothetical protein